MKRNTVFLLLLALAAIPALKALFIPGFYTSHDGVTHTARIANFFLALMEGQIPPRIAPNLLGGLGFPIFIFIYPLPYLLASWFHFLGASFTASFEIVMGLSFLLSAAAMYFFTKEIFGPLAGFTAALFYSWAPYRFSQIYVRGALAEYMAYIFIPLVLLALVKLSRQPQKSQKQNFWVGFGSLSLSFLLLSHQLVSLMFSPVILAFFLLLVFNTKNRKSFIKNSLLLFILGFLISSYIYFPALFERRYLKFDELLSYYPDHFVTPFQLFHSPWSYGFSLPGQDHDDMSFQIGLTHILVTAISLPLLSITFLKKNAKLKLSFSWALLSFFFFLLAALLMLESPLTSFAWKKIPGLSLVDFPWRWLGVSVFSASILAAYLVLKINSKAVPILLIAFLFYANRNHLRINQTLILTDAYFTDYLDSATSMNEFLPFWKQTNKWQNLEKDYRVIKGDLKLETLKSTTLNLVLNLDSDSGGEVEIHRLYFPGWNIFLDGRKLKFKSEFQITRGVEIKSQNTLKTDRSGFLLVKVPPGKHLVRAKFSETRLRRFGFLASILGFLGSLALLFAGAKYGKKKKK